jgi:hypothetical protein
VRRSPPLITYRLGRFEVFYSPELLIEEINLMKNNLRTNYPLFFLHSCKKLNTITTMASERTPVCRKVVST